jgi:chromate reductase
LRAAAACASPNASIDVASIDEIPLYNADVEERGIPSAVVALKDRIARADGLVIATPEYNNSIPGVVKNAVDWCTRPADDIPRVFHGLPVAIMGASNGRFGTILAQNAWLAVLRTLRTRPWLEGRLMVSDAEDVIDASGAITDAALQRRLERFVSGFIGDVRRHPRS